MKKEKAISLLICFIITLIIIPFTNLIYSFLSILIILLIGFFGLFFHKDNNSTNTIIVSRKPIILTYYCEFFLFVIIGILLKLIRDASASSDLVVCFGNIIFFLYISKDIVFRGIGFRLTKISYNYTMPKTRYQIVLSNFIYCSVFWIALAKTTYNLADKNNVVMNIMSAIIILLIFDQFYLIFIGKTQSLINKIVNLNIYSLEEQIVDN